MMDGTPEAHLDGLADRLAAAHQATRFLSEDAREPFDEMLIGAMRSTRTMRVLADHLLIAVAGRQSAGKTRLVRSLYDLDHRWLSDNLGRGEVVPILVVEEEGLSAAQGAVQSWSPEAGFEAPRPVSPEEFQLAATQWSGDAALPILRVPRRFFSQPRCGFLLLPGYEPLHDDNRSWQQLMRLALVASDACVLVTDASRLAEEQDGLAADIRQDYLASSEPVVVVTKTELDTPERREELRATAATRFQVALGSTLCIGQGETFTREWREALRGLLLRNGGIGGDAARSRQLKELRTFNRQIESIVQRVRRALTAETMQDLEGESVVQELLEVFNEARDKLQGDYEEGLSRELGRIRKEAITHARDSYDVDEVIDWTDSASVTRPLTEWITGSTASEHRMRDRLQAALRGAGAGGKFAETHGRLLRSAALVSLQVAAPASSQALSAPAPGADDRLPAIQDELAAVQATVTPEVASTIRALLTRNLDGAHASAPVAHEKLKEAITLLPAIATAYLCVVQDGAVRIDGGSGDSAPEETSILRLLGDAKENSDRFLGLSKEFVVATAGLLLIDGAIDGQIDTFSAVVTALGAGGPWVTSAIVAATVAFSATTAVAQHDARKRQHIYEAITEAIDEQRADHVRALNRIMDALRARLRHQLVDRLGLDDRVGQRFWAMTALHDLRDTHRRFLEAARPIPA